MQLNSLNNFVGGGGTCSLNKAFAPDNKQEFLSPKYYIINIPFHTSGLFCICIYVVLHSVYALREGYIPIVDLKHNNTQYFKDGRIYKDNAWEYFFEQPAGVSLSVLKNSANITVSRDKKDFDDIFNALRDIKKFRTVYKDYLDIIKLNPETKKYVEENYRKIVGDEKEVLGIVCRGSDYVKLKLYGHNIQPDPEDVLKKAKELFKKFNYKRIWLATEDANIYKMFKDEFGNILLENKQYMFSDTDNKFIADIKVDRPNHAYTLAMEYLASIYIISKCKYIIGGVVTATLGAWLLSEGFKDQHYVYLWDLGQYGVTKGVACKNIFEKILSVRNQYYEDKKYKVITILGKNFKSPFRKRVKNYIKKAYTKLQ